MNIFIPTSTNPGRAPSLLRPSGSFILFVLLLAALAQPASMLAQEDSLSARRSSGPNIGDTLWSDTKALWSDGLLLFSAPAHFGTKGWGLTGGAIAGTGLTMLADDHVRDEFAEDHNEFRDKMTDLGNFYGTGIPGAVVIFGLYTGGLAFDAPGVRLAGRHVAQSFLYAGLTTTLLKVVIGRHRPDAGDGPQAYSPFKGSDEFHSLPSGHATLAFAISSSLAADIDNPWATVGLYSVAALTAASRIYVDRHWLSDTFLGAAIGTACGWGVVHLHDKPDGEHSSLYIIPSPNSITAVWMF